MSQIDKLILRIKNIDKNLRFEELEKVLNHYGYYMKETSGGSSHATFRKPNKTPITIPRHNPINKAYVILVKMVVESEDENEENA